MNYLAHIYLSGDNDALKIGNFISDFIRGNKYKNYPEAIQKGILLHRKIDSFTDENAIVRKSKRRLHERYKHYDGIIIDIIFDHFLAKNWQQFSEVSLLDYETHFLELLKNNFEILPVKVQQIFPYMKEQKWLSSYATLEGIEKVLKGVNKRTNGKSKMDRAITDLKTLYVEFEQDFTLFFIELQAFVKENLD